jgi:hypothetical protein
METIVYTFINARTSLIVIYQRAMSRKHPLVDASSTQRIAGMETIVYTFADSNVIGVDTLPVPATPP